jgi:hypothetical protein
MDWHKRTRFERLAALAYPNLVDDDTRRQMTALLANEGRGPPSGPALLADHKRGSCSPLGGAARRSK